MIEFLNEFPWTTAAAAIVSVISSISALIFSLIRAKAVKDIKKALDDAKKKDTRIVCPKCHKESSLREVHFLLPDGSLDDNLNGVADDQE